MSELAKLTPYKWVAAPTSALLSIGTMIMTKWLNFVPAPPPLYHYPSFPKHFGDADFWSNSAVFLTGVVSIATLVFLPRKNQTKFKIALVSLTAFFAVCTVALAGVYDWERSKWTFNYRGETVLMGNRYTPAGKRDPRDSRDDWFGDFGGNSRDVWTDDGLRRRRACLGLLYLFTGVTGGISWAFAVWTVTCFLAKAGQQNKQEAD